jgi:hypothetical protein
MEEKSDEGLTPLAQAKAIDLSDALAIAMPKRYSQTTVVWYNSFLKL